MKQPKMRLQSILDWNKSFKQNTQTNWFIVLVLVEYVCINTAFYGYTTFQARKLYRSMVLEKKRAQAATIIAAYYTGWKVNMLHLLNTAGVFLFLLVFYFRFPVLL